MNHLLASVDLGSNSFRLIVGRVEHHDGVAQVYPIDNLKETVRLAAGLDDQQNLDDAAIERALTALQRFGERLRSFHPRHVRAVATNTFRVAQNSAEVVAQAEAALGFPIEVIAGREEARLIFSGVAHSLPASSEKRLIIDIGGGSTECTVGTGFDPELLESLNMGCVSFSKRYFPDGTITERGMRQAVLAARSEAEVIAQRYRKSGWKYAYGSSGTAKALGAILPATGLSDGGITRHGLQHLRDRLIRAKTVDRADLQDIRADRAAVLPGGLAIMLALFEEFDIDIMQTADGALRVGVLYDLLGRQEARDTRAATVNLFMERYNVDRAQAGRVRDAALTLHASLPESMTYAPGLHAGLEQGNLVALLGWAADLHECGLSIAHARYPRHSAYILANADMPGFSNEEQEMLALLCRGQSGKLSKLEAPPTEVAHWMTLLCLRLAVLLFRRRESFAQLPLQLEVQSERHIVVRVARDWLDAHPLTEASLQQEQHDWERLGLGVRITLDDSAPVAASA